MATTRKRETKPKAGIPEQKPREQLLKEHDLYVVSEKCRTWDRNGYNPYYQCTYHATIPIQPKIFEGFIRKHAGKIIDTFNPESYNNRIDLASLSGGKVTIESARFNFKITIRGATFMDELDKWAYQLMAHVKIGEGVN